VAQVHPGVLTLYDLRQTTGWTPLKLKKKRPKSKYPYVLEFIPLVIIMFQKKDGGISAVAKKRSAIGTLF
jgi:hypothetical protein